MRTFTTDIFIFLGLLILTALIFLFTIGQSAIDIQLHDTYFVLDKISLTILIIGPLTLLIFLSRGLTRKFRTKGANMGLIVGLLLVALITYQIIQFQESYLIQIMKLDDEGLPDRGQFAVDARKKINWTWGLFGFWTLGIVLLTFRTIKIWKERYCS
jgi:hypothetical protein